MDAYTAGLLAVVSLSVVAIAVPTVRFAFEFSKLIALHMGKGKMPSSQKRNHKMSQGK